MIPEDIVAWLLEAEVITEDQAKHMRDIAERNRQAEQKGLAAYYRKRNAEYAAKPWWYRAWKGGAHR